MKKITVAFISYDEYQNAPSTPGLIHNWDEDDIAGSIVTFLKQIHDDNDVYLLDGKVHMYDKEEDEDFIVEIEEIDFDTDWGDWHAYCSLTGHYYFSKSNTFDLE